MICGLLVLFAAALSLCTQCAAAAASGSGVVIMLDDSNFDTLTSEGIWMVDVYSPS
jgi:hypothetical protein